MKSYSQALKILKKGKINIGDEYIDSEKSLNRVSSENVYSNSNHPSANNSSLDGFAIKSNDTKNLNRKNKKLFEIIKTVAAGDRPTNKKNKNFQTIEIMTGTVLPKKFDAIIPIEEINFFPNKTFPKYIIVDKKIKKNQHIRFKGSDFRKNDLIIKRGTILQPNHILAFKALGIKSIKVKKKPNILFFSSGNEISNKENIPTWKVRNSNTFYVQSIKNSFLFNFFNGGILRDKDDLIFEKKIKKMLNSKIDIIITSGGVSAGKFDYIPKILNKFKLSQYFKGVAIRPGKPILFGKIFGKQKVLFGLPGNPLSTAACFRFFVYPYLENLLGTKKDKPIKAILKNEFKKKINFTRFVKSKLNTTKDGKIEVKILKGQESYKIQSFVNSNIWTVLPAGKSKFEKNDLVECFLSNHSNKILS